MTVTAKNQEQDFSLKKKRKFKTISKLCAGVISWKIFET